MRTPFDWLKCLALWIGALFPACKQATRLQSDALDRRLPLAQRLGLRIHLLLCKWCRRYGRQIALIRAAARQCGHEEKAAPMAKLSEEARQRIKERLKGAAK